MYLTLKLIICISGFVSAKDARTLTEAANRYGFASYYSPAAQDTFSNGCALRVSRGDADTVNGSAGLATFDDAKKLSAERAGDLMMVFHSQLVSAQKGGK